MICCSNMSTENETEDTNSYLKQNEVNGTHNTNGDL